VQERRKSEKSPLLFTNDRLNTEAHVFQDKVAVQAESPSNAIVDDGPKSDPTAPIFPDEDTKLF